MAYDWEIYVGPSPFGFVPGQVTGSFTAPNTLTGTAPTLLRFTPSDFWTSAPPTGFSGSYDFATNTMTSSQATNLKFAGTVPYDANGLYVQTFLWTEADDNIDLQNIEVTVSGTTVPEPSTLALFGSGILGVLGVARRRLLRWPQSGESTT